MKRNDIRAYVEKYLQATSCRILQSDAGHIKVQLSERADKDLVNRPFYWSYVEKLGLEPQYTSLTFIFDEKKAPPDVRGEAIAFGSPRLQQIFQSARRHGRFVRLYEDRGHLNSQPRGSRPFVPWLAVNYKISYLCDQLRNELYSVGIQLLNGAIENNFFDHLLSRKWTPRLPSYHFVTQPKLSLTEALNELEFYIQGYLDQLDDTWARQAEQRMQEELNRLEAYYRDTRVRSNDEALDEERERRLAETRRKYQPRIDVTVVNAGLFYMF